MLVATDREGTTVPFYQTAGDLTTALEAGQVAGVDASTNLTVDFSAAPPTYQAMPMIYLAQGSFYTNDKIGPFHGGYQETVKSKGINARYVSKFYRVDPADAVNEVVEVCTNECEIDCDTVYDLRIDIKGSPTLRFLTHNLYQTLSYKTPCCDDAENPIDPMLVLLGWADQINGTGSGNATIPFLNQFIQAVVWLEGTTYTSSLISVGGGVDNNVIETDRVVIAGVTYYVFAFDATANTVTLVDVNGNPVDTSGIALTEDQTVYTAIDSETYVPVVGAGATAVNGCLQILGAYVDTVFGDCSFNPKDHFEKEPIKIYASAVSYANNSNDLGDNRCEVSCFEFNRAQEAVQGKGYGETLVRELILVKSYRQECWSDDPRMREVTLDTVLGTSNAGGPEIARNGSYSVYHLLHSVPRKSNPDGTFDNDQYLVKVVVNSADVALGTNFEAWVNAWLVSANNAVQLEVLD
jgi:hypothetical protein